MRVRRDRITTRGRVHTEVELAGRIEEIKTGKRFRDWCEKNGRDKPPRAVVQALNRSMDEGAALIKSRVPDDPTTWRNYCSFLGGRGQGRV